MFKVNKSLWYTTAIFLVIQFLLFFLVKFAFKQETRAKVVYICFMILPLILIVALWVSLKIRFGNIKKEKINKLTPRDKELIAHYIPKQINTIGFKDLKTILIKNSFAYLLAYSICFVIALSLFLIMELA